MGSVLDLQQAAADLLEACEDALALTDGVAGPGKGGVPARSYVDSGVPVVDCEMLCVYVAGIQEESTSPVSPIPQPGHRVNLSAVVLATLVAVVARCVPVPDRSGRPPSVDALALSGVERNVDAWAIWNETSRQMRDGELFEKCNEKHRDGGVPINTSGGFGGWQFTWRVLVPGFTPGS